MTWQIITRDGQKIVEANSLIELVQNHPEALSAKEIN